MPAWGKQWLRTVQSGRAVLLLFLFEILVNRKQNTEYSSPCSYRCSRVSRGHRKRSWCLYESINPCSYQGKTIPQHYAEIHSLAMVEEAWRWVYGGWCHTWRCPKCRTGNSVYWWKEILLGNRQKNFLFSQTHTLHYVFTWVCFLRKENTWVVRQSTEKDQSLISVHFTY